MKDLFKESLEFMVIVIPATLLVLALVFGIGTAATASVCSDLQEVTGRKTEFRWQSTCYVEVNGKMVPRSAWKVIEK